MIVDDKLIEKIAELARLSLSSEEKIKFKNDMTNILNYFDRLSEVDTSSVDDISQITGLSNIYRDDNISSFENSGGLVAQAPSSSDNGSILVKNVL